MKTTVNGMSINNRIDGPEGAPWLTFSNSLATNLSMWDAQVEALAADYRILRYDTRGHGDSEMTRGAYSLGLLVGDVVGLLNALGIERSHFVGLSLGGMTALGLALDHPQRLSSMAVCDARSDAPQAFRDSWPGRIAVALSDGMDGLVASTMSRWFAPEVLAQQLPSHDKVRAMIRGTSPEGYAGCARALQALDYRPRLGKIAVPTLFLVGAQDSATPPEVARAMHGAVPGSAFAELAAAGHLSNIDQPDAFNQAIAKFLSAAAAPR